MPITSLINIFLSYNFHVINDIDFVYLKKIKSCRCEGVCLLGNVS